MNMCQHTQKNW